MNRSRWLALAQIPLAIVLFLAMQGRGAAQWIEFGFRGPPLTFGWAPPEFRAWSSSFGGAGGIYFDPDVIPPSQSFPFGRYTLFPPRGLFYRGPVVKDHEIIPHGENGYSYRPVPSEEFEVPDRDLSPRFGSRRGTDAARRIPDRQSRGLPTEGSVNRRLRDLAVQAVRQGLYEDAAKALETCRERWGLDGTGEVYLGHAYFGMQDYRLGADALRRAAATLDLDDLGRSAENAVRTFGSKQAYLDLLEKLEVHVAQSPGDPDAQLLLGYYLGFQGRNQDALAHLGEASALLEDDPLAADLARYFGGATPEIRENGGASPDQENGAEELPVPQGRVF